MKRKAFGYGFILLVIIQLISPWMVNISSSQIKLEKNIANAAGEVFTPEPRIGYIKDYKVTAGGKTTTLPGLVFMYVDTLESGGECFSKDVNFYIYNVYSYSPDWQSYDETVDSTADCSSSTNEWHTDKINTDYNGSQVQTIRHYYGTEINGFNRRIALEYDLGNISIEVNPNKIYGDKEKEILITKDTKTFGPTPSQTILDLISTGKSASEQALHTSFGGAISSSAFLSDKDQTKIVGEFNIKIQNKGAKWQDNGSKSGEADEDDEYGAWDAVYDDELLSGQAGYTDLIPDNDGATGRGATDNGFDGFIFDISDNKDFKGQETMSINLNKLILEGKDGDRLALFDAGDITLKVVAGFDAGKSVLAIPEQEITLNAGLDENKKYYYRVRIYPDNLREGLHLGGILIPEDAYILSSGELNVPPKNTLGIVQNPRSGTNLTLASGQETEELWLPDCKWDSASTWFTGCLIVGFYHLVFEPTSALLAIAGKILDKILIYSISPGVYKVGYIVDGWRFVRDLCNLFFIFMLIFLAFKVILNFGHGTKKLIVNTIIIATVINFSYPLTTIIIDISNITARQLYYNAFTQKDAVSGEPLGLSSTAVSGYNPQQILLGSVNNQQLDKNKFKGSIFMILLIGVIFNIIAMFLFLKIALQFIYRILGLVFAIILSPIALFSYSLETEQRKKLSMVGFDQWLSGLLQDCFKAPVFLFLILIMTLFIKDNPFKNALSPNVNGLDWWMSIIIPFMLIMGFLMLIEKVTKSMSSSIAEVTGAKVMQGLGAVAGVAMGGAALAGTGILGKAATKFAGSNMGQRIFDNAAKGNKFSELQAKLLRKAQTGSYDLRQTGIGNAVSKETGANFNLGAAALGLGTGAMVGGYMGQVERRNKKRDEFVQMLEWNKNLAQSVLDKKNAKEEDKKKKEDEAKVLKDQLDARERDLKNSEEIKKNADETYSNIEKLEDLLAKRNDIVSKTPAGTTPPTNEIDIQIDRIEAKLGATAGSLYNKTTDATGRETVSKNTAFNELERDKKIEKENANANKNTAKAGVDTAKDNLKTNEQAIRQLDKDINELTKAIENIKKNRKNMYAHKIRNKSGHVFNKYTYGERKKVDDHGHAHKRAMTDTEETRHNQLFGELSEEMKDIVTSVDEHSHEANNKQLIKLGAINASIGALAGAFTGGAGAIAVGALTGGLIGAIRSVSPGNEHYGVPHDKDEWHPHSSDGYKPPSGGGTKSGGDAHAHDDHH